jgi:hypothetical protein
MGGGIPLPRFTVLSVLWSSGHTGGSLAAGKASLATPGAPQAEFGAYPAFQLANAARPRTAEKPILNER